MVMINVSEARSRLPELLTRAEEGEEVTITRHGRAVAMLVRPDIVHARDLGNILVESERLHDIVATAGASPVPDRGEISRQRAEELIASLRAGRDAR